MKTISPSKITSCVVFLFCLSVAITGCERHTRHKVLTFFFTGVPSLEDIEARERAEEEKRKQEALKADQAAAAAEREALALTDLETQTLRLEPSSHKPYSDGSCHECHLIPKGVNFGMFRSKKSTPARFEKGGGIPAVLSTPRQTLCVRCHDYLSGDFADMEGLWLHTPTVDGDCYLCHDPHVADYPKLLLRKPLEVCLDCHAVHDIKDTPEPIRPEDCLACHNAHLGIDRLMLKSGYVEAYKPVE